MRGEADDVPAGLDAPERERLRAGGSRVREDHHVVLRDWARVLDLELVVDLRP